MSTVYRAGDVTVTLTTDMEALVRRAVSAASGGALEVMEAAAEEVVTKARANWYGPNGVERETGKSGDIVRQTVVSDTEVRVRIVSTDQRPAGKSGKVVPLYVHRPGRLSLVPRQASHAEYWAHKARGLPVGPYPTIYESNPGAGDGKYLVPLYITGPTRAKVKSIAPELGRIIAQRMEAAGG